MGSLEQRRRQQQRKRYGQCSVYGLGSGAIQAGQNDRSADEQNTERQGCCPERSSLDKREKSTVRKGNTRRSDQSTFNLRFYWLVCRRRLLSTSLIGEDLVQIMEVPTDKCFELNVYQARKADNVMDTKSYQHRELHGRPVLDALY